MKLFKKILIVLGKHGKREFVIQFFLMVISALLEMIGIASIPIVMRLILEPERLRSFPWLYTFLEKHNMLDTIQLFIVGSGVILSVFILKNLYRILVDYRQIAVVKTVQIRLATQLFQKYLLSSYSDYLKRNTSVMIRNIQNEVIYITSKVLVPVFLILLSVTILLGLLISLLIVEPMLTIVIFLVLLIAMSLFNFVVKKKLIGYGKIMQNERRVQLHYLYQGLQGYKAIKVANKEKFFTNLFDRTTRNFAKMQQKASILNKLPVGYLEVVSVFVILVMVGSLMIIGYTGNELTYLLSFFGLALIRMRQHFSVVMTNIGLIRANQVSFDPVIEDLTDTTLPLEKYNAESDSVPFIKEIVFDNVCFTYDGTEQAVIKNLNLKINKGEIIGIAGSTGGGKTTVVDILLGLHTPTTGKVMVDNIPLSSRNITAWQQQIGYVPQVIYLLDNTIKNNIAFGIDEHQIDDSLIEKVINLAQLDEFIDTLPDGINTEVGENGVRLSGGQRQRIGIARALYQSPELLILDEATSALDNITERKFMNMLYSLQPKVTILMIAHRLSTLEGCDNIIYLKNGMIDAQGTYNELIEKSQEFKNLTLSN